MSDKAIIHAVAPAGRAKRPQTRAILPTALLAALVVVLLGSGGPDLLASPGDTLYLQAPAELRAEPGADSEILRSLERGRKLLEFERRPDWVRVGVFGAVGLRGWLPAAELGARPPGEPEGAPTPAPERAAAPGPGPYPLPPDMPDAPPPFELAVTGSPALAFVARCQLVSADGPARLIEHRGLVPARLVLRAEAALCEVRKRDARGRLTVALRQGERLIATAETAAAFNFVRVQSAGPWGTEAAVRGGIAFFRHDREPPPPDDDPATRRQPRQSPIVPPLTEPSVPPLTGRTVPPLTGEEVPPLGDRSLAPSNRRTLPLSRGTSVPPLTGGTTTGNDAPRPRLPAP